MRIVPGVEAAGITVVRGSNYRTVAPSGELPRQVDEIQYELRTGPCVDAIVNETTFRTGDLENDPRWPTFGKRAAVEAGVHSMLAIRLFLADGHDRETIGALNMYSTGTRPSPSPARRWAASSPRMPPSPSTMPIPATRW